MRFNSSLSVCLPGELQNNNTTQHRFRTVILGLFYNGITFYSTAITNKNVMKNLLYNLDSTEESYRVLLTSIIQIDERITDMIKNADEATTPTEFERSTLIKRLNTLINLNDEIKTELDNQSKKINTAQLKVDDILGVDLDNNNRYR